MTYFGFLAIFLVIPLLLVSLAVGRARRQGRSLPAPFQTWPFGWVIAGHVVVAVLYTTPWDNYLVATEVWWYDPDLVSGIVLGYVPLEEYTFFVLQTILTGLWVVWLAMSRPQIFNFRSFTPDSRWRMVTTGITLVIWLISTIILVSDYEPANYLTLILSWALIPVMIQLSFGADILWHYRRLVGVGIAATTLFLAAADLIAIAAGTWTISPDQTLGINFFGILPLEEFLFFLMTNILVVFGVTLVLAQASHERSAKWLDFFRPVVTSKPNSPSNQANK